MKVLFLSAVLPYPLYSGGQVRIYNLLKALSRTHEITLFSFIRRPEENQFVGHLSFCRSVHTVLRGHAWQARYIVPSVFGKYPLLLSTYNNTDMRHRLAQSLASSEYDLVHIEPGYVWPSIPDISVPLVVAEHNIEHAIYADYAKTFSFWPARPLLAFDVAKLKRWERRVWERAHRIITVSEEDYDMVTQYKNPSEVFVVSNGVDPAVFRFRQKRVTDAKKPRILFVGNFSWVQNRDAVRFLVAVVLPKIYEKFPTATLRIVGKNIPPDLRGQLKTAQCELMEKVEDITTEYAWADVLLAPIRIGGGTKFKILEAMASGVAVITTSKGAMGLEVKNRREVLIANSVEEILTALHLLTTNNTVRLTLVKNARARVDRSYTWERIAKKQNAVWQSLL